MRTEEREMSDIAADKKRKAERTTERTGTEKTKL